MTLLYVLWLAGGALLLWLWLRLVSAAVWWSLGYRRFRGTWYSALEYSTLMTMLKEDQARGDRRMWPDEVRALSAWQDGATEF